jgi:hypothetical protein
MGVTAAAGSFGQFLMVPVENWLIGAWAGRTRCSCWAAWRWPSLPLAWACASRRRSRRARAHQQSVRGLREAFAYPSFRLLMAGYFVCGFQVVFIGVHMPSYLKDHGLAPDVATTALALIGLFNVFGTYAAGVARPALAKRTSWPHLRLRSVAIVAFLPCR